MCETRISSILGKITVLFVICFFALPAQAKYGGGKGELNDPYLIYTAEQMNAIGADFNDRDKHFKLMADIDLRAYTGTSFNIIGKFTGVFDGNGKKIFNFTYTSNEKSYIGLFGDIDGENAVIKDLGLIDANINAGMGSYVGSLVAYLENGSITNCYVEGGSVSGEYRVGGLVGKNENGKISKCYATGSVFGYRYVGGLVGYNDNSIVDCYTSGNVTGGNDSYCVGGLCGKSTGPDHGPSQSSIQNCYSTATVTGNESVGGLIGHSGGIVTGCYSTGSVTGKGDHSWSIGGLIGRNGGNGSIKNCYSTGSVVGDGGGGLVGSNDGTVFASFWDIETSGQTTSDGGAGLTTAEMQMASIFVCWGYEPVWTIDEGVDYPRLVWENKPGELITVPSDLYGGGSGEPEDPYLIYTAEQLNMIGLNTCHLDKHFRLMADIDLSVYTGTSFNIIGNWWDNPFTGVFDGNGRKIFNFIYTSTDTGNIGLFGYVGGWGENAEIKNLGLIDPNVDAGTGSRVGSLVGELRFGTITNCYVEGGSVDGRRYVGGLVGGNDLGKITNSYSTCIVSGDWYLGGLVGCQFLGTISNCYSTGSVSGDEDVGGLVGNDYEGTIANSYSTCIVSGDQYVGGLVGRDYKGTISNSYVTGSVTGNSYVGGLVGKNWEGTITNCYSTGGVSGDWAVGGLVGGNYGSISHCYSTGFVSGGDWYVGGLVGDNYEGSISHCYSTGDVSGDERVGCLVGVNNGSVSHCYSTGDVSGYGCVGGLVGYNDEGSISNCCSTGDVSGTWDVGGLVGGNGGGISNCYSTGDVSGDWNVGGLAGGNFDSISNCFWDTDTQTHGVTESIGQNDGTVINVAGLPTAQMQTKITFTDAGWDFVGETVNGIEDIWFIPQGDSPHLWWEGIQVSMKLTPRTLNCRSRGNWVKAHLTLPEGFTVADVDPNRPAVLHSFGFQSLPLYVFVNQNERVQIEAAFEREAVCSLAGDWPEVLTVAGFLADGNIFLGTSTVRMIAPGMKVIEDLANYWLIEDCVHPNWCDGIDMNRDSLVNLLDYALLMKIEVEFVTDE